MSLHGQISINARALIFWEAKRLRPADGQPPAGGEWPTSATELDAVNVYHCWVRGARGKLLWEGEMTHRYGDGAAALAGQLLTASAPSVARVTLAGQSTP